MNYTLKTLEEYIARLDIKESNYYIFEALMKQPYDIYRPIMDMLFEGKIVIEDLILAKGETANYSQSYVNGTSAISSWDVSAESVQARCIALASGTATSAYVNNVDTTALMVNSDGTISSSYVPTETSVVGSDSATVVPNAIEVARAGSYTNAQKSAQEALLAAISSIS